MASAAENGELITDGWFYEVSTFWPGESKALKVKQVLYHKRSQLQDILVFESTNYGRVLVLDGVIQATEKDECGYQEMMAHVPLCAHPCPKDVLVIGGGDGGVVREIIKNPKVERVVQCEIDKDVVEVTKKYMPSMCEGAFDSPKLTLLHKDGFKFLEEHKSSFDVIITDSSDPIGPAESLFQPGFYNLVRDALKPGGVSCSQGESVWLHLDLIVSLMKNCRELFPVVQYGIISVPTYPGGSIGMLMCGKDPAMTLDQPVHVYTENTKLKYYSSEVHKAAFLLPKFAQNSLNS